MLLVGSCIASLTSGVFELNYSIKTEFIHVGMITSFDAASMDMNFDFQIVSIPMDAVMPLNSYLNDAHKNSSAAERRFNACVANIRRLLYDALRFNREHGLMTL